MYPLTIIADRYNGSYSGGRWTAWNRHHWDIPVRVDGGDIECETFWNVTREAVGRGDTPEAALADLRRRMGHPED